MASQIIQTLTSLSSGAADTQWATRFWEWITLMERGNFLSPRLLDILRDHGYQGAGTTSPPVTSLLVSALSMTVPSATTADGGWAAANAWTTSSQCLHQAGLAAGFRRAAPEIYAKLRAEGCPSTRAWLRDNFVGYKGTGSAWTELWSMASQVDFALAHCTTDAAMLQVLNSDDRVETSLRHLGAHFYETRTRDKVGAAEMRAFSSPGASRDIVPGWLVAEATLFSKNEHQRNERVEAEVRRRSQSDKKDKGKGKGKEK